jgi:benzoate/toluate 1,2-dioxygenase reductase component
MRLLRRTPLSGGVVEIEMEKPQGFMFTAGQNVRLFAGDEGRDYSMANGPSDETLRFCVRLVEGGAVSSVLAGAPTGTVFSFAGPHGVFALRPSVRPVIWAATGVGIAPFLSMARDGAAGFSLLHGVRTLGDLFYQKELESCAARYVACVSREAADGCFSGRVTRWAAEQLPSGAYDFYLCGSREMIRDFIILIDEQFPGSRVYTEVFF